MACLLRLLISLPFLLVSCVDTGTPELLREQVRLLSRDLRQLSNTVSPVEADRLATVAIEESAKMSADFKPMSLPWMNNMLVNMGLRKRGLCYEWRDDLFPHLFRLRPRTMDLHLVSSRRATRREHNGIIVTARGAPYQSGIILDPWRKGGRLWWGTLAQDKRHPWKPLPWKLTPMALRPLLMPELYPSR